MFYLERRDRCSSEACNFVSHVCYIRDSVVSVVNGNYEISVLLMNLSVQEE